MNSPVDVPITICVVEDDEDTRKHLVSVLNKEARLQCLGAYASAEDALRDIPPQKPDVALVDINLPGMNGIECVAKLKAQLPALQILILTKYEESDLIFNSLLAGARGYLLKKMVPTELVSAIEQVYAGGAPMSMPIARKVVEHFCKIQQPSSEMEKLTKREHEVLTLLARGYHYKEIGETLGISFSTVRTHLEHIYGKLHVQSRTEATIKFLKKSQ